jgi:SAM-dependent methyltransferase
MVSGHKDIWDREHTSQRGFTTMHTLKPSESVPAFAQFLQESGYVPATTRILDIGCGKGRNSLYMASLGFRVTGTDFSDTAIDAARMRSADYGDTIQYEVVDLTREWPYGNGYFDAILDCNTTIYIPDTERSTAIAEAFRVLKPGGYYLFYGIAASRPAYPASGATTVTKSYFEKNYTEDELKSVFSAFQQASMGTIETTDRIEGVDVVNTQWVAVYRKPQ